ncbi:MAG: hypothetical protein GW802_37510, partial [Armatimonadetes bacterium]|nr:hypothetical protein [Armatimonadota bacterium]
MEAILRVLVDRGAVTAPGCWSVNAIVGRAGAAAEASQGGVAALTAATADDNGLVPAQRLPELGNLA